MMTILPSYIHHQKYKLSHELQGNLEFDDHKETTVYKFEFVVHLV